MRPGNDNNEPLGPEPPPGQPEVREQETIEDLTRPVIRIIGGRLAEIATEAESALLAAKVPIYRRDKELVRPVVEAVDASHGRNTHVAQLAVVTQTYMRDVLARTAHWEKWRAREKDWVDTDPPMETAQTILNRYGEWRFRPMTGVLTTPTLRPDGTILSQPGYDPVTRLILMEPPAMPDIAPTRQNVERALALLDALLDEFAFADQKDEGKERSPSRSVALSALITPVVRAAFPVAPMHAATAPVASSGKSYLWDTAAAIAIGNLMPVIACGRSEEETEKRLSAVLLAAQPLISIDNVNGMLGGDFLCQAVERQFVEVRVLGESRIVLCEPRGTSFFATGNNIQVRGDMTRRVIRCTLDPREERPELHQYRGDPVAKVLADRGRYLAAGFCVVRAYLAAGRPDRAPKLASFEGWSDAVRSALIWLGRADPCDTMMEIREDDPERTMLAQLLKAWDWEINAGYANKKTVAELFNMIEEREASGYRYPELRNAILATASRGRTDARSFGNWLRRYKDRIVGGLRLTNHSDEHGHRAEWWIEKKA
jgi:putative DNA primase/helicase